MPEPEDVPDPLALVDAGKRGRVAKSTKAPPPEVVDALVASLDGITAAIKATVRVSDGAEQSRQLVEADAAIEQATVAMTRLLRAASEDPDVAWDVLRDAVHALTEATRTVERFVTTTADGREQHA